MANIHCCRSGAFSSRRWRKVAIKISHIEKLDGYTCFVLILLVQSDLVCRLPGKLDLSLVICRTPEAIYLQLVGGCVQWW